MAADSKSAQRDPQTYAIIGAALEVHRELGAGFLEPVYQEALRLEFTLRSLRAEPQPELKIHYKGRQLNAAYGPDFICFDSIVVELKALAALTGVERAQVINYLKATGFRRGLLINFGTGSLQFERIVFGREEPPQQQAEQMQEQEGNPQRAQISQIDGTGNQARN